MNVKNLLLGAIEWLRSRVTAMKSEKGRWKRERLMADTGILQCRNRLLVEAKASFVATDAIIPRRCT